AGVSFRAVSTALGESPFVPPDSMGDIGPTQILVHVNGRIRVFDRNGVIGPLNSNNNNFWEAVRNGFRLSDPNVRYDRLSGRWFLVMMNLETVNNRIVLAVSDGPTITGSTGFTLFYFNVGIAPAEAANVCDYPGVGVDAHAVTIGCNMYSSAGSFQHSTVYVVRKSSLLSGGPIVVTPFVNVTGGITAGPWSPRGVDNDDPLATESYFIGVDIPLLGGLMLRRVTDPGGTPLLSGNIPLAIPATSLPLLQVSQDSSIGLDTLDDRLFMAAITMNKVTGVASLWTAHHLAVDASCVAAVSGSGRRNAARFYEFGDLTAPTPTLLQAGTLCDTAAAGPRGFIYPSVIGTGQGHVAIGASSASANAYAGVAVASRRRDDPPGTIGAPLFPQSGLAGYTVVAGSFNRWGDYSFTGVDPNDDMTVWTFQEYADAPASNWAVRVLQLVAPPPAVPAAASPAAICAGAAAAQVTITGDGSSGGEFFDPGPDTGGPGFASHLAAAACPGVTVTSAAFIDPTHVALTLDAGAAVPGGCDIALTNPDGQSATGPGLLAILAPPVEVNDTLALSDTGGLTSLAWNDPPGEFNVYRGVRSGASWTYNHTCFAPHLASQGTTDPEAPPVGSVFFYLVARTNDCGESAPGRDSQGAPNPIPAPCN
ncbi:MAG TPA: hypothetical protein VFD06_10655, partial [Candidatus Polarisedimenticolia bacterium]|nr:hypothetical protein [Candidatus Polarisedimenticolia bacterium]